MTQGIGLRWAFMGPAMCAHLGGGKGGLKHRLEHLGWRGSEATKISLSAAVEEIAGATAMDDLERWRDADLVTQRRALEPRDESPPKRGCREPFIGLSEHGVSSAGRRPWRLLLIARTA